MAAVLACGPDAALSHSSAAELWAMLPAARHESRGSQQPIHVTVPGEARHRSGIRVHRSVTLNRTQVTRRSGIPVTTPSRTLADLRRVLPPARFAAALRQAEFLRLPIDRRLDPDHSRSELEARFLGLCRRHRLDAPEVNIRVGPFVVDFVWPEQRLVVEVDGYRTHGPRSAFEADRARDIELKGLGYDVIRLTWRRLTEKPAETAATLRRMLRARQVRQRETRRS